LSRYGKLVIFIPILAFNKIGIKELAMNCHFISGFSSDREHNKIL